MVCLPSFARAPKRFLTALVFTLGAARLAATFTLEVLGLRVAVFVLRDLRFFAVAIERGVLSNYRIDTQYLADTVSLGVALFDEAIICRGGVSINDEGARGGIGFSEIKNPSGPLRETRRVWVVGRMIYLGMVTSAACKPLGPFSMVNSTFWPSFSER